MWSSLLGFMHAGKEGSVHIVPAGWGTTVCIWILKTWYARCFYPTQAVRTVHMFRKLAIAPACCSSMERKALVSLPASFFNSFYCCWWSYLGSPHIILVAACLCCWIGASVLEFGQLNSTSSIPQINYASSWIFPVPYPWLFYWIVIRTIYCTSKRNLLKMPSIKTMVFKLLRLGHTF